MPKGAVNPFALKVLASYGYPVDGLASKSWQVFAGPDAPKMDFVLTVCDNAAGEACPLWPGQPVTAHWGIEDPAAVEGSDIEKERAFVTAFRYLKNRVSLLISLPVASLNRLALTHQPAGDRAQRGQHVAKSQGRMRSQRFAAEALGTGLLLATVIGSGIMGERLAGGNVALALLGNTLATGAMLVVLITMFGPISGAHFNPAVTAVFALAGRDRSARRGRLRGGADRGRHRRRARRARHVRRERPAALDQGAFRPRAMAVGRRSRRSGCVLTILLTLRANPAAVATSVGLYITAAYWFTASTSFANPAVTIARALSDTFAGIRPADVVPFIVAQFVGAAAAAFVSRWLVASRAGT